jgi:hypothetical protein
MEAQAWARKNQLLQ